MRDLSAVEFGSANWSYNGFTRSDEVVVIIHSRRLADQYLQYLSARWREVTGESLPLDVVEGGHTSPKRCEGRFYGVDGRRVDGPKLRGVYFRVCGGKVMKFIRP